MPARRPPLPSAKPAALTQYRNSSQHSGRRQRASVIVLHRAAPDRPAELAWAVTRSEGAPLLGKRSASHRGVS